jgi:hypothetical protein
MHTLDEIFMAFYKQVIENLNRLFFQRSNYPQHIYSMLNSISRVVEDFFPIIILDSYVKRYLQCYTCFMILETTLILINILKIEMLY